MDPENGPQSPSVGHTDIGLKATQIASALPETNNTEDSDLVNVSENQILRNKNSDRFKSHKIDRFLSPSPVARALNDQEGGTSEEEEGDATSRTTEDSQSGDGWPRHPPNDPSIRPQTAPLLNNNNNTIPVDHRELRNKSVPLSIPDHDSNQLLNRNSVACNQTLDHSDDNGFTWHPHVYAKPPKQPTPHSISDILGLSRTRISSESNVDFYKEENSRQSFQRMGSSSSISESSDSEEQFRGDGTGGDQPLNLCLSKSRSEESPRDERRQSGKSSSLRKGE